MMIFGAVPLIHCCDTMKQVKSFSGRQRKWEGCVLMQMKPWGISSYDLNLTCEICDIHGCTMNARSSVSTQNGCFAIDGFDKKKDVNIFVLDLHPPRSAFEQRRTN